MIVSKNTFTNIRKRRKTISSFLHQTFKLVAFICCWLFCIVNKSPALASQKICIAIRHIPGRKSQICRYFILPSSIEAGSSKARTPPPNCSPHTDNISGAIRVHLGALNEGKVGAGSHMFESSFISARSASKETTRVVRRRPNIYFLSKAPRWTRMVI